MILHAFVRDEINIMLSFHLCLSMVSVFLIAETHDLTVLDWAPLCSVKCATNKSALCSHDVGFLSSLNKNLLNCHHTFR